MRKIDSVDVGGWAMIIVFIMVLLLALLSCEKQEIDNTYTIKEGYLTVSPPINFETDTLKCRVMFHENCLKADSWNKLFLWGQNVSFIWKGEDSVLSLGWCYGIYDDYSTEIRGKLKTIYPGVWYNLMITEGDGVSWFIDDKFAIRYGCAGIQDYYVESGELGGCAVQDKSYELIFN